MEDIVYYILYYLEDFNPFPSVFGEVFLLNMFFQLFFFINLLLIIKKWINRKKIAIKKKYLNEEYSERIINILLAKHNFDKTEITDYLAINSVDNNQKKLLTDILIHITEKYNHINQSNYKLLLEKLNLKKHWENELQYGSKKRRERALRKIGGLNLKVFESIIIPMTTHKDSIIRKRARNIYLYISKNNPFKFFNEEFEKEFTQWDAIEIDSILQKKPRNTIPNFIQWIREHSVENSELKSFLVYEMAYYRQTEALPNLIKMLNTTDLKLRQTIIRTFGVLKYKDSISTLINMYNTQPSFIQQEILKTLSNFNEDKILSFLQKAIEISHDKDTFLQGLNTLYNYGEKGRNLFYTLKEKAPEHQQLAFLHIEHPLNQN